MEQLWDSVRVGQMTLQNRLAMAPMTRNRSTPEGVPTGTVATYYGQRASFGLIVTEGTQPSEVGQGYMLTPGIYTQDQIDGWKVVTELVHARGGRIFIQLMHVGRVAHPANTPHGRQPVAPSAIRPAGKMFTMQGPQDMPEPRALSIDEIDATVRDFRHAAACAIAAGADGVEIHAANGYLIHQFLSENANHRSDEYGESIANRVRFAVDVAAAIADEIGAARTAATTICCAGFAGSGPPRYSSIGKTGRVTTSPSMSSRALPRWPPSASSHWRIRIWSRDSRAAKRSTRPTPARSTAVALADTPTIRR
jgi:N-ethylmaleimide reductase